MHSVVDVGTLKQIIGAAQIGFDDLKELPIGGFRGLFVFRKYKDMKLTEWLKLNQILANLGYTSVFVSELERLQFFSSSLEQAQEFYQDFSQEFWQNPLLDCDLDVDNIFARDQPQSAPPANNLPFGQEVILRQKLRQALESIASTSLEELTPGYASVMRFLAGNDCALSTDAFEQAALKLDQLECLELVPVLEKRRSRHKVPSVKDYQQAASEIDLEAWLDVRKDTAIETRPEPPAQRQIAATRAQQLIDSVQHLMLVPVVESDLVPAFFHLGGVNDMPPAHVHLALLRRWATVYGAKPQILGLGPDSIYVYVAKPVSSSEQAARLAIEQFRYCPDSVLQSLGSVGRLASEIKGCDLWQFWWE